MATPHRCQMAQYLSVLAFILSMVLVMVVAGPLEGTTVNPAVTPSTGYFAPADQPIDVPDLAWKTFPTGESSMRHRPWVQPRVPTGPIVFPSTASIGAQYAGVLLPQPLFPFAAQYISYPKRAGLGRGAGAADYTNKLAPPIFLETDVEVQESAEAEADVDMDVGVEADVDADVDVEDAVDGEDAAETEEEAEVEFDDHMFY